MGLFTSEKTRVSELRFTYKGDPYMATLSGNGIVKVWSVNGKDQQTSVHDPRDEILHVAINLFSKINK